jgi:hypothetical protein
MRHFSVGDFPQGKAHGVQLMASGFVRNRFQVLPGDSLLDGEAPSNVAVNDISPQEILHQPDVDCSTAIR